MVKLKIDNANCPYSCNSLGQVFFNGEWQPCPLHGKKSDILLDGKLPDGSNIFDLLKIPVEYENNWVSEVGLLFKNEDISLNCSLSFSAALQNLLETLLNVISIENNIYMESIYVYANPKLLDLKPYVYTLQRIAFENNIGVLPAVNVNDLCGLMALQDYSNMRISDDEDVMYISKQNRLAGEGADWYLRTGLTYTDYLRCSLCFVFDNSATTQGNLRTFSGFIEERARRGLPTYVFSTAYFDNIRESLFFDKFGRRKLSSLTPYLLLGKSQEYMAREKGWLSKNVNEDSKYVGTQISGYSLGDFQKKQSNANTFDL